ncbi:hypothetical protein OHB26_39290 (plasmid) [Nocardia sp. NBC_01503]|uniref:hypothetical protein n=1 Tax=Nocardia sp. NBC_01503 TaxID=2975997 RepID=UPI002E7BF333|nr:hypothetical protein [Nocardia sp. NBC_01503]WTL36724.1 hypothetical protein OHB26_39290 [Nocardia sp. NBC_01503]
MLEWELPGWVAGTQNGRPRVPIGQVVSWCRWPVGTELNEYTAGPQDTLASIAAGAFPMRCLACWAAYRAAVAEAEAAGRDGAEVPAPQTYRIDELTEEPDPGSRALEEVACPHCGTVGLWPPNRPAKELHWANKQLWSVYGADTLLPEGQVVLVPELHDHEVVQRADNGAQPTYCDRSPGGVPSHISDKADRPRTRLVSNSHAIIPARPVDLDAPVAEVAEGKDSGVVVDRPRVPVEAPVVSDGHSVRDAAVEAASAALAAEIAAPETPVSGDDALDAVRAELAAGAQLLGDSAQRVTRAVRAFDQLVEALVRERAELAARCATAEQAATAAKTELEKVGQRAEERVAAAEGRAEEAERAQLRAEGQAEFLTVQLEAAQSGEIQQAVAAAMDRMGARRSVGGGERVSKPQRDMIIQIGNSPLSVTRNVATQAWHIDQVAAVDGPVKTLDSLLRRNFIAVGEPEADGFAMVSLIGVGAQLYSARTGRVLLEVAAAPVQAVQDDPEAVKPPSESSVQELLRRVGHGRVTRRVDGAWVFDGTLAPPRPASRSLDWMLTQGLIEVGEGDPAPVVAIGF